MALPYLVHSREPGLKFQMVQGPTHIEFTAGANGRLLKFSGARLARAEVNKNSDEITAQGIDELAATVAGTPIDVEHEELSICGIFTEGVGVDDPVLGRVLEVGGLVHADRYPEVAAGVQDGSQSLSIEADGQMARCSICNKTFASSDMYCEHLKNKFKSGAVRTVEGLTCLGGGIVRRPAGNGTDFANAQIKFVASQAEPDADENGGPSDEDADDNKMDAGWLEDELPKGQTRADLDNGDFADPKNRKFPYKVHGKVSKRGWIAAWAAANGSHTGKKNQAAIDKLKRDKPAGVNVSESEIPLEAHMNSCPHCGTKLTAAVDACPNPACAKPLTLVAMSEDLAAALANLTRLGEEDTVKLNVSEGEKAKALAAAATLTASLEKAQADLTAAQEKLAQSEAASRRARLGARIKDEADWEKRKPTLLAMDETQFATLLELSPLPTNGRQPAGVRLDGEQAPAEDDKRIKVIL